VRARRSFVELRTVGAEVRPTFRHARRTRGLLRDDK